MLRVQLGCCARGWYAQAASEGTGFCLDFAPMSAKVPVRAKSTRSLCTMGVGQIVNGRHELRLRAVSRRPKSQPLARRHVRCLCLWNSTSLLWSCSSPKFPLGSSFLVWSWCRHRCAETHLHFPWLALLVVGCCLRWDQRWCTWGTTVFPTRSRSSTSTPKSPGSSIPFCRFVRSGRQAALFLAS